MFPNKFVQVVLLWLSISHELRLGLDSWYIKPAGSGASTIIFSVLVVGKQDSFYCILNNAFKEALKAISYYIIY